MNSPQSPCALAEPRSAVARPLASAASCWLTLAEIADQAFEFGHADVGIVLRFLDFFAKLFDLFSQGVEQSSQFFLAAFGEGL